MAADRFSAALEVRVLWAHLRIAAIVDPENVVDSREFDQALSAATQLGRTAYPDSKPPLMIADVSQLVQWFQEGIADAAIDHEIAHCLWCQDDTGNPCPQQG
ncbi:hypothetical protein [Cupriavidus sp. TMH.W2]|uniref:hypothetical protein n=1 Tax=Cupriavidus sp. TMH.W2 TaxID=3434465 RepID=UPI003D77489D